ncbi:MAG: hypothetical protein AB1817_01955 [Chloroflexota bacterium]
MAQNRAIAFSEDGLKIVQECVELLRVDLGASVGMLHDVSGQLLTDCGWHGDFDINTFLALLGNQLSASNAVVHLLRDEAAFDLHYHEGRHYEMYTVRISDQVFLTLILERRTSAAGHVGMVWLSLRRAITELRKLLNRATIKPGAAESKAIPGAISAALDDALNLLEGDRLLSQAAPNSSAEIKAELPELPATRRSPVALADSSRVLTFEEARALGLINLDDLPDSARESEP